MSSFERKIDELTAGVPRQRERTYSNNGETNVNKDTVVIRKKPIMWGVPCDEVMYSRFFTDFITNAHIMPWDAFAISESTYLPKARNIIWNAFIDSSSEYLAFVDSDILFAPYMFNKLISHRLPIVSGWYRNKKGTHHPVVYDFALDTGREWQWQHRTEQGNGLERVDGVGMGAMLVQKEAAVKIGKDPFDMEKSGEDLTFCKKLIDLNIPLHVDWNAACAHLGVQYV